MPRQARQEDSKGLQEVPQRGRITGRHKALLSDPKVRSWWEARSLRSRMSADQYLRQFGMLLERLNLDPAGVVALAKRNPDRLRTLLVRDAASLKEAGRLDSYVSKYFEGLKAYFRFHHVLFDGYPSLSPIKGASLATERVPTQEELGVVLDKLSLRGRVIALFMAHTGVRPGVLGSYQAEGGLTLGDLPDLKLGPTISFTETPFVVRVPARLSKTRVMYTTFGSSQLGTAFLSYLGERRASGEALSQASPVVASNPTRGAALRSQEKARFARGFLTTKAVMDEIRSALQSSVPSGVRWRPYVLRAYCSTRLMMAEGAGRITRDLREAILGHDGGIAARYNVGKTWGDDLMKEARAAYSRSEPYLVTVQVKDQQNVPLEVAKAMLQLAGYSEEEIAKLDLEDLGKVRDLVRERMAAPEVPHQEIVPVDEVPQRLAAGWQFVATLGATQVILTSPSSSRTPPTPTAFVSPLHGAASPVPPSGQVAMSGSMKEGVPAFSAAGGSPSIQPLPPRVSGRPAEEHSGVAHRMEPHRDTPEEESSQ